MTYKLRLLFLPLAAVAVVLMTTAIRASSVRPANLVDIVEAAQVAFIGTCIEVIPRQDPVTGRAEVSYTFRVERYLKGGNDQSIFSFLQSGPYWDGTKPQYQKGQKVVLFLYPPSRLGYTSAVARQQGAFEVHQDETTRRVTNALGNADLFRNIAAQNARQAFQLTAAEAEAVRRGGELPLEVFSSVVEKIRRAPAATRQRFASF